MAVVGFARPCRAGTFRVLVRTSSEVSRTLRDRIVGQTSDLDVELEALPTAALEPSLAEQMESAAELAQSQAAEAVVWCEEGGSSAAGGFMIFVAQPSSGRVLVRKVGKGRPPSAADLEASALIVRLAIQALMHGGVIGVEPRELGVPERAPPPVRAPEPVLDRPEPGLPSPTPHWRALALLGWQTSVDGQSPQGAHGLATRLGASRGRLELGLLATMGWSARLRDPLARIDLARHTLGLWGGAALVRLAPVSVTFGGQAGVALFTRSTIPLATELVPTPSRLIAAPFVGPEVRVAASPSDGSGVALSLAVGCDFIPGAPVLGYDVGGRFQGARALFQFQPRAALQVELQAP